VEQNIATEFLWLQSLQFTVLCVNYIVIYIYNILAEPGFCLLNKKGK